MTGHLIIDEYKVTNIGKIKKRLKIKQTIICIDKNSSRLYSKNEPFFKNFFSDNFL